MSAGPLKGPALIIGRPVVVVAQGRARSGARNCGAVQDVDYTVVRRLTNAEYRPLVNCALTLAYHNDSITALLMVVYSMLALGFGVCGVGSHDSHEPQTQGTVATPPG